MSAQSDFKDRLAGFSDDEIWLKNNVKAGDVYFYEDCHHCEQWTAYSDTCDCGRNFVIPIADKTFDPMNGEFELVLASTGMPDWAMIEVFGELRENES